MRSQRRGLAPRPGTRRSLAAALAAALAAVLVTTGLVTAGPLVPVASAAESNLSRNASARATASYQDGTLSAANAIDGDGATRWSSDHSNDANAWVQVDLGASYAVTRAVLRWEAAYARAYRLQVSGNGSQWEDVYSTTTGAGGTETLAVNRTTRYVRVQGVTPATQWGYSLWELEVYGDAPASGGPTFYANAGYGGAAVTLGVGDYDLAQLQAAGIANDSVSSLRIPSGYTVTAYQDGGFAGTSWTFTADSPDLATSGANDGISSVRISTGGGGNGSPVTTARSTTYPRSYDDWENGLLAGNGKQGIIVFGNPRDETVVFDDRDFFMARPESRPHRTFNTVSQQNIDRIRDLLIAGSYSQANQLAADVQGYQGGGEGSKHPGFKMTLQLPSNGAVSDYSRSTDYENGVVGVRWTDSVGAWQRESFVSRTDGVTVQYLPAPTGKRFSVTLGQSIDPGMNLLNKGVTVSDNSSVDFLDLRAKYPNGSYNAGYEGVTRIVTDGTRTKTGTQVAVSNASYVMLLSLTQRYDGTYEGGQSAEQAWSRQTLQNRLAAITDSYQSLRARHTSAHRAIFDRVSIDLGASAQDRAKSNETLLAEQKGSGSLSPALLERMFYAGRYHLLGSSDATSAPDLLGNWTGDSNVGWDGYYHLDANLNLQISGANIGNMPEAIAGYFYLNKQWQADFRTNARKLLGTRGMLTGGNTPNGEGLISNINFDYPYQYVTGGESWLLYPFWQKYQITGDRSFLANDYYPLIRDMGDFYEDFLKKKDANGNYIFAGSISPENRPAGGVPLSVNSVYDISGARFALSTLIETSRTLGRDQDKIPVWQELLDHLPPYIVNNDGALAEWAWPDLANKNQYQHRHSSGLMPVWPYREVTPEKNKRLYDAARVFLQRKDTGSYENAGHGLLHGALIAADLNDAASVTAKLLRFAKDDYYYSSLSTSHYNNHGTFATDVVNSVPTVMMEMLATSDPGTLEVLPALPSTLTKGSISGMLGKSRFTIDKLAWDTNARKVDVTLTSAIDQNLTLIQRSGIAAISSPDLVAQSSPVGNIARVLPLKAGKTVRLELTLGGGGGSSSNLALNKPASASSSSSADQGAAAAFDGNGATRWSANQSASSWLQVDLGSSQAIGTVSIDWESSYAKAYRLQVSLDGSTWVDAYTQNDGRGGSESIPVNTRGRYVRMQGVALSGQWGYSIYELKVYGAG